MFKYLVATLVSTVLAVSSVLTIIHVIPPVKEDFTQIRAASWQLTQDYGSCSSTVILPEVVVTAAHCDGPNMKVNDLPATVLAKDEERDVMVLSVPGLDCPCISVVSTELLIDEKIYVVGYPLGLNQTITEGRIQGLIPDYPFYLTTVPVAPGNSGGGVFKKGQDGKWVLVGVVSSAPVTYVQSLIPNIVFHLGIMVGPLSILEVVFKGFNSNEQS